jgi:catechol 2,3-dioxygenase-like lactoylglutathione lyase family enzyme
MVIDRTHIILYVTDQDTSTRFYGAVLSLAPTLQVPGMTEFALPGGTILGLMPETGVRQLLGDAVADPKLAGGIPRCELYLVVADPSVCHARALAAGAREISGLRLRSWGHVAAYSADPDGHVLAFAAPAE